MSRQKYTVLTKLFDLDKPDRNNHQFSLSSLESISNTECPTFLGDPRQGNVVGTSVVDYDKDEGVLKVLSEVTLPEEILSAFKFMCPCFIVDFSEEESTSDAEKFDILDVAHVITSGTDPVVPTHTSIVKNEEEDNIFYE